MQTSFGVFVDPVMILAALAGGAFGAALGALPAFIFTGFMVIAGQVAEFVSPEAAGITGAIAFGPPFSPAISFAGGAAATAYAAKQGYMDTGFDYHEAKNILFAQGTKPDVLLVGAVFGVVGYWITQLSNVFLLPWDSIAMGVVLSALIHRVAFGYPIIGDVRGGSLLDMSPFEREEMRPSAGEAAADGGTNQPQTDGGVVTKSRLAVEPWLPHQYKWVNVATLSVFGGLLGAFIALETGLVFLGFGISAASLVFLNCGVEQTPVTHHITLIGSAGAVAAVGGDPTGATTVGLLVGAVFGLVAGLSAEAFQRVFYAHGDTHWDPPAAAIVIGSLLIGVLAILGILPDSSYVPTLGL
ncbi:hypothetical protein AUR64_12960 [Haloprofundus marisrubri]|uniref:DUF7973 domain-containing protein n=1 Tax=Haloprofundus marisrubri TaxID=1514971 RepID=A0A0W1RAX1_9EURY|nr:hypothetical protein [Haloprofundus marisrubri]KTG10539.1 hypothetical protein AUR64_12960 [Haloprofundus marisrubri]